MPTSPLMPSVSSRNRKTDELQLRLNADMSLQRPKRSRQLTLDAHFGPSAGASHGRERDAEDVSPEPRPVGLLDLPDELLERIAAYLDLRDAARCAKACRRLRAPSQAKLYHTLDLDGDMNPFFPSVWPRYLDRPMAGGLNHLSMRFKDNANLLGYVKELRVVSYEGTWINEENLIESLEEEIGDEDGNPIVDAARLQRLRVNPSDDPSLRKSFDDFPILPNVRRAYVQMYRNWEPWLRAWLRLMPNVKHLKLNYINDVDSGLSLSSDPWPVLPHLQHLEIAGMEDDLVPFVISCVKQDRGLEALLLTAYNLWPSTMFIWEGHEDRQLAKALSEVETIRKLDIPAELREEMEACRKDSQSSQST